MTTYSYLTLQSGWDSLEDNLFMLAKITSSAKRLGFQKKVSISSIIGIDIWSTKKYKIAKARKYGQVYQKHLTCTII